MDGSDGVGVLCPGFNRCAHLLKLMKPAFGEDSLTRMLLVAVGMASFPAIAYLYVAQCIRFVRYLRDWSETTECVLSGIRYFFEH